MKKHFASSSNGSIALFLIFVVCFLAPAPSAKTAVLQAARVTIVIKDVKLLPRQAAPRVARVSDTVSSETAVRTGVDSRAELTFADLTITRLGANTVFTFNEGTRELDLGSGAILLQVPKGGVPVLISTPAVTAAISGGTALCESNSAVPAKLLVLEGRGQFCSKAHPDECETVHGGEMSMMTLDGHITKPVKFNAGLVFRTSKLIKGLPALPNEALILGVIEQQQAYISAALSNPLPQEKDNIDIISARTDASPASTATSGKFGPPSAIASPNPYVITSGTEINTDPTITTNGITNFGKIYRGLAQDGPLFTWLGSSPSSFDTAFGENGNPGANSLPVPGFLFAALRLDGDPTVFNSNSYPTLGLVSQNGITSSQSGAIFTFGGMQEVALIALSGSIDLSGISFANFGRLIIEARGSGGNLTLAAPISNLDRLELRALDDIQVNAPVTVKGVNPDKRGFKADAGNNFQTGSTVNATQMQIRSLGSIQINSSAQLLSMLDSAGNSGQIVLLATGNDGSVNVGGQIQADQGSVDIRETGITGVINVNSATLRGDIVKVGALGSDGALNISAGNSLDADTEIDLYADGSNGTINFLSSVTLTSPKNVLAAKTINISPSVIVTINSNNQADIFTDNPNYFGWGGNGTPTNSGTFGGVGAKNPQPFSGRPPFDSSAMMLRRR